MLESARRPNNIRAGIMVHLFENTKKIMEIGAAIVKNIKRGRRPILSDKVPIRKTPITAAACNKASAPPAIHKLLTFFC